MAAGFISQEEVIMALGWKASNVFWMWIVFLKCFCD
jgi:hypothetical protein